MEALGTLDERFFLFLNGLHTDWMDKVMIAVMKAAMAKVLAAWEDTNPYFPPAIPLGRYIKS